MKNLSKVTVILSVVLVATASAQSQEQVSPVGVTSLVANATIGNGRLSDGTTVYSGDLLKTEDQGRATVQSGTMQFVLGADSALRIFRLDKRTILELERGTVAYTARGNNEDLTLFALDIRLVPSTRVFASGQVQIVSRCDVNVTALHSTIEVTSSRETRTVEETKSFKVLSEFGVDYRDSWQPVLADYPEYPRDAQYHQSHAHVACPAGVWQTASRSPVGALASGHFAEIVGGGVGIITGWVIHEAVESPDKP